MPSFASAAFVRNAIRRFRCDRRGSTRVGALFPCVDDLCIDVRTFAPGTAIVLNDPIDASGAYAPDCQWQQPQAGWTTVVRAFYPWPLYVTGLGYNISNINRGHIDNKRLLAVTSAFIPQ